MNHTQFRAGGPLRPPTTIGLHVYQLNMRQVSMCLVLLTQHLATHSADVLLLQDPLEGLVSREDCLADYELYLPTTDLTPQPCPTPPFSSHPYEVYIEATGHPFLTPPCLWHFCFHHPLTICFGVCLYPLF